jgi:predicted membrane protein
MKKWSAKMFWGFLFLSIGILLILQNVFGINLPILRILFGLFLIYLGIKVIAGSFGHRMIGFKLEKIASENQAIFMESNFKLNSDFDKKHEFTTAFGSSSLDLSDLPESQLDKTIKIENAFGKTKIKTNPQHAIKAKVSIGFGSVKIRGQKLGSLGEIDFKSENFNKDTANVLMLDIDNAFGEVIIE